MSKELKSFMDKYLEGMVESHIECWGSRYEGQHKDNILCDLDVNHDPSLEVEYAEEVLGRELTDEEFDILVDTFNASVVNSL